MTGKPRRKKSTSHFSWELFTQVLVAIIAALGGLGAAAVGAGWLPNPFVQPTPAPTKIMEALTPQIEITAEATPEPQPVILLTRPDCPHPPIYKKDTVILRLRWDAINAEYAESNADQLKLTMKLDGHTVGDVSSYRQPAQVYSSMKEYGCRSDKLLTWIHWDVPVGYLTPGPHQIVVTYASDVVLFDGENNFGPGEITTLTTDFVVLDNGG
jgi:hypothetical protein